MNAITAPKSPSTPALQTVLTLYAYDAAIKMNKKAKKWDEERETKYALIMIGLILAFGPIGITASIAMFNNPYRRRAARIMRRIQTAQESAPPNGLTRPAQARKSPPDYATLAA